jgi:hypothetical protein
VFKFFGVSVTQQNGQLIVHNPISIMGCVFAVFLAFVLLLLLTNFTDNPLRAAKVGRAVGFYVLKLGVFLLVLLAFAFSVQSNDLTLDASSHKATDTDCYLFFLKTKTTYDLSRIQRAEVYGSRNGGADRLSLVFADGHVHSLTSNNMKYGKNEAAMAINNYLATAQ